MYNIFITIFIFLFKKKLNLESQVINGSYNYIGSQALEFMHTVVRVIFRVAYCYKSTRDICYKEGNSLLFAICSSQPQLIGLLLAEIDTELMQIGKRALNLCAELPFNKWLPHITLTTDLTFIQKCLLMTPTNSIMFKLTTNLIDALDFSQSTSETSRMHLHRNTHALEQLEQYGLIDLGQIFKLKLTVILFELHSRLTIYNYYSRQVNLNNETVITSLPLFAETMLDSIQNMCGKDKLGVHYAKLAKDKRLELTYWIWATLYRMNQFFQIDNQGKISYIESLAFIYSLESHNSRVSHNSYLQRFFDLYLTQNTAQQQPFSDPEHSQSQSPKCPLECYTRLIFTNTGHSFGQLFEQPLSDLVQTILGLNKKQTGKMSELTYMLLFDWLESLLFKHANGEQAAHFEITKHANSPRFASLVLLIFSPANKLVESYFCSRIHRRLEAVARHHHDQFNNYFKIWLDALLIRNWHKYKNLVKIVDFLIKFLFFYENSNLNAASVNHQAISLHLIDKLIFYVRQDFGLVSGEELADIQMKIEGSEAISTNIAQSTELVSQAANQSGVVSNWIQPSLGWISHSLTYVVTTTTSQIGSTVSAAIGMHSLANDLFDATQPFAYDKRLYKEFPYAGYYLGLCEERIESELELWSIFRSYLTNDPLLMPAGESAGGSGFETLPSTTNSLAFIESCWRKTLHLVNRNKHLSLNMAPQRLMLFKWCERACELAVEEPILILYWQKFFQIYLDKDYVSSGNRSSSSGRAASSPRTSLAQFGLELMSSSSAANKNGPQPIESVTFKLFTGTTQMNTLLKQIKKVIATFNESSSNSPGFN